MLPGWLSDLLLESPMPPPIWFPTRSARLAEATTTLRRRFGLDRSRRQRPSFLLRDLSRPYPGTARVVSGGEIEAELEADITSVNPPVFQGWALFATIVVLGAFILGLAALIAGDVGGAGRLLVLPTLVALALALVVGHVQREIELNESGVRIRRWTDIWRGQPGLSLGPPTGLRISMRGARRLDVMAPIGSVSFAIPFWPRSARQDLHDELPIWGVQVGDEHRDRHHRRHPG